MSVVEWLLMFILELFKMRKIDATVIKETKYIAIWVILLSVIMQFAFLIFNWTYAVLLGTLLGAFTAILNFFLMGITVQSAITKDEKSAKDTIRFSQIYRTFMLLAVAVVGMLVPCFNGLATIIPFIFPRIAIAFRPLFDKKMS